MKIYGIKNCDTVKKALKFLDENSINHEFIDYKKTAPNKEKIAEFIEIFGIEKVLNKRGTTWRKIDEAQQKKAENDQNFAIKLMAESPSMIKRPILISEKANLIGFKAEEYEKL